MDLSDLFKRKSKKSYGRPINDTGPKQIEMKKDTEPESIVPKEVKLTKEEELRIDNSKSYVSRQDLYPTEILALAFAEDFKLDQKRFDGFWSKDYKITDMNSVLDSLCNQGFLTRDGMEPTLRNTDIKKLKKVMTGIEATPAEDKETMIKRILASELLPEIIKHFPPIYYSLTPKGRRELIENEYVLYAHNNRDRLPYDLLSLNKLLKDDVTRFRDIIWSDLNDRSKKASSDGKYREYRDIRAQMYDYLTAENRNEYALEFLFEAICYDLNGMGQSKMAFEEQDKRIYIVTCPDKTKRSKLAKRVGDALKSAKMSVADAKKLFMKTVEEKNIPMTFFTTTQCWDIIIYEKNENLTKLNEIYNKVSKKFRESDDPWM